MIFLHTRRPLTLFMRKVVSQASEGLKRSDFQYLSILHILCKFHGRWTDMAPFTGHAQKLKLKANVSLIVKNRNIYIPFIFGDM